MISDSELIAEVLSGAVDRYAELVRRYERSVRAAALSIVGDQHAAEDLTQEVFVQAFQKLENLRTAGAFGPWLLKIARRRAVRASRQRKPVLSLETVPCDAADSSREAIAEGGEIGETQQRLLASINRLSAQERLAVTLKYFEGYSVLAIAEATGCTESAILKRLSRARERLKRWLAEEES